MTGSSDAGSHPTVRPAYHEDVWFWIALGFAILLFGSIVWRFRQGPSGSSRLPARQSFSAGSSATVSQTAYLNREAVTSATAEPLTQPPTETASSETSFWQDLAIDAEQRAERASAVVRAGLTPHLARMMKDQLVWTLMAQRTHMVSTQEAGTAMVAELEQRLEQIRTEFESRVETYEKRITELERELETTSQINRELIEATIDMAKKAMHDVAVRQPDSPLAAKYLGQKTPEEGRPRSETKGRLSFGDIMARRASRDGR